VILAQVPYCRSGPITVKVYLPTDPCQKGRPVGVLLIQLEQQRVVLRGQAGSGPVMPAQVHYCRSGPITVKVYLLRDPCQKGRPVGVLLIQLEQQRIQS